MCTSWFMHPWVPPWNRTLCGPVSFCRAAILTQTSRMKLSNLRVEDGTWENRLFDPILGQTGLPISHVLGGCQMRVLWGKWLKFNCSSWSARLESMGEYEPIQAHGSTSFQVHFDCWGGCGNWCRSRWLISMWLFYTALCWLGLCLHEAGLCWHLCWCGVLMLSCRGLVYWGFKSPEVVFSTISTN